MVLFLMSIKSKVTDYLQKSNLKPHYPNPQKRAKKEREETSFEISSLVSGCGLINDYRSLSNYLKEFSDFIHWYEQMFDRKPFIKKSL